jgi:hypothetical protein
MPARGSFEVGQRRFWNAMKDVPGVMWIAALEYTEDAILSSDTGFEEPMTIFANGPITFPPEHKLARTWKLTYKRWVPTLSLVDYNGTGEWIFKPYSTKMELVGADEWMRGDDWRTANLFYDASPHAMPTSLKYTAMGDTPKQTQTSLAPPWAYNPDTGAQGFGNGGRLYGYDNDVYFGNNEMGGGKENVGVGPKTQAIGDLSKTYPGLWGTFGISHGTCINNEGCTTTAEWVFDLCWRPAAAAMFTFNNQLNHGYDETYQSEGWGTDVVALIDAAIELTSGIFEYYRQFSVDVSPSRETMNVYTLKGQQLTYGIDYIHDKCDQSGRSYRLVEWNEDGSRNETTNPIDPCDALYVLVVTYLVTAATLRSPKRTARQTDTNEGHDRLRSGDIRGL